MSQPETSRRELLMNTAAALGAAAVAGAPSTASAAAAAPNRPADEPFGYCLNTSTIREQKLGIVAELELAAKTGYHAVEPWIKELDEYVAAGGSLKDLKNRIRDLGLTIESSIGFAQWIVDDDVARKAGLEEAKRCMGLMQEIGGKRIAAPPAGAQKISGMNLFVVADRYRALLELADQMGIDAELEVWGHSQTLGRLGEAVFVAVEAGHPRACLLPDVYHIFKGGSDFHGLKMINGARIPVFHLNDYPATPSRAEQTDADRVYPGDGVAPLKQIFTDLYAAGFRGYFSLELFNRTYWQQPADVVVRTGLEKMRASVRAAFA